MQIKYSFNLIRILLLAVIMLVSYPASSFVNQDSRPLVIHVKTSLSIDDAQICAFPNVAWAALASKRSVIVVFDGSAVACIAQGFGWRGWFGIKSTALDRATLPARERMSLARQLEVPLEQVPHDYGEYLHLLSKLGAEIYYNATMALLYQIDENYIDPVLKPLQLKELVDVLSTNGDYLAY